MPIHSSKRSANNALGKLPGLSFCLSILYELTTLLLRTQYDTMEMRLTQTICELQVIQAHLQTIEQLDTQYTKMIAELATQSNVIEVCAKEVQEGAQTIGQWSLKIDDGCRQIHNAAQEFSTQDNQSSPMSKNFAIKHSCF